MFYLAECYLPVGSTLASVASRARTGAEQAATRQGGISFVEAIFLPGDESCFLLYQAHRAADVTAAGAAAGLGFDRVTDALVSREPSPDPGPREHPMPIQSLLAGQAFHREVQSAFLTGLAGAAGFPERPWRLIAGRRGRVDLAVEVGGEQMLVIIEIKGTDWDKIPESRTMPNLRRHLRQLQGYLDTAMEDMGAGEWAGGIAGCLLYPARPARAHLQEVIETTAGEQDIMVTWYEDTDWRHQP